MSHRQHSHRHKHHHDKPREPSSQVAARADASSASEQLFTIDRKGDNQNLRYGSIDKYKVPKYRAIGYGRLLGLDRRFRLISTSATERHVADTALDSSSRTHKLPLILRSQVVDTSSPLLKPEVNHHDGIAEQQDYVTLGRKRRRLSQKDADDPMTSASHDAESASESNSGSSSEQSEDENQVGGLDSFEAFKNHPDNKRQVELRSLTDQNPQNVHAWLDLIEHQDRYFALTSNDGKKALNASQRRTVTDMKVSLYERAIATVRDREAKEKLVLGLMREGSKIWDTNKQSKEWQSKLSNTSSISLWYEFLNFQQTNIVVFSYERCLDTYLQVLKIASSLPDEGHDYHCVYLMLRLTTFMHEAGFSERAIAIWQALLEYNLCNPSMEDSSVDALEKFWESEVPRIGEVGAKGWHSNIDQEVPAHADHSLVNLDPSSLFTDWGRAETQRSTSDTMPARTLDDTVEDDPFRVILFSDLRDFVFKLRTDDGLVLLMQAFMKYCGLPPMIEGIEKCRQWWTDPFLCDFALNEAAGILPDTIALFAPADSRAFIWSTFQSKSNAIRSLAVNALMTLVGIGKRSERLLEYTIALRLHENPSSSRKFAKQLLKKTPNSLILYNAYALVEARLGNKEAANNVWSTALSMAASLGPTAQRIKVMLWHTWIWELLQQKQFDHALNLLLKVVLFETVTLENIQLALKRLEITSAQLLRADEYYRDQIYRNFNAPDEVIVNFTALFAMLRYLTHGSDFDKFVEACQSTLSLLVGQRFASNIEHLQQFRALFADFHATTSPSGFRPKQLVSVLEESVMAFPHNGMFFELHEKYLRRAGIVDRLRTVSDSNEVPTPTIVSLLHIITKEISRPSYSGSTVHSVRRAFTVATENDAQGRYCPAVWTLWVNWELSLLHEDKNTDAKQLRGVYYSAIRSCPWCKDLYLQGFVNNMMARKLRSQELEEVYRSMSERGLRVRHDITDLLDQ